MYADVSAVKSRAGALASAWTDTSAPGNDDIEGFLTDVAAEIDALLSGRGYGTPATGTAAAALRGVNADGALVLALQATYVEASGPNSAGKLLDDAQKRYEKARDAIAEGKHPAVALLEASSTTAPSASTLWSKEPGYGLPLGVPLTPPLYPGQPVEDLNPYLSPQISKGQSL